MGPQNGYIFSDGYHATNPLTFQAFTDSSSSLDEEYLTIEVSFSTFVQFGLFEVYYLSIFGTQHFKYQFFAFGILKIYIQKCMLLFLYCKLRAPFVVEIQKAEMLQKMVDKFSNMRRISIKMIRHQMSIGDSLLVSSKANHKDADVILAQMLILALLHKMCEVNFDHVPLKRVHLRGITALLCNAIVKRCESSVQGLGAIGLNAAEVADIGGLDVVDCDDHRMAEPQKTYFHELDVLEQRWLHWFRGVGKYGVGKLFQNLLVFVGTAYFQVKLWSNLDGNSISLQSIKTLKDVTYCNLGSPNLAGYFNHSLVIDLSVIVVIVLQLYWFFLKFIQIGVLLVEVEATVVAYVSAMMRRHH